jgi:glycosyltransferase involved in cell wall biosynthesis
MYPKAKIIVNDTDPFSKAGLLKFPKEINKECDICFIPNFIIPFGIKIPVYSIVHDLIFLDMKETTTKGFIDYKIKKTLFKRCFKKSKKIFCVSKFTINRAIHYFPKYKDKLILSYNGLSKEIIKYAKENEPKEKENNIIYIGNVKPHKGINILLDAFMMLPKGKYNLKIIGQKEKFLVGSNIDESKYENVVFTGRLSDDELLDEISKAKYLVQPSLYEGFGIPPLEALECGCKNIYLSNIEVFKEIYDGVAKFFDPLDYNNTVILDDVKIDEEKLKELKEDCNWDKDSKIIFENIKF